MDLIFDCLWCCTYGIVWLDLKVYEFRLGAFGPTTIFTKELCNKFGCLMQNEMNSGLLLCLNVQSHLLPSNGR